MVETIWHWLTAYRVRSGEYDAKALVKILRQHFVTFGVAVELTSDGGPQTTASEVEKFLEAQGQQFVLPPF